MVMLILFSKRTNLCQKKGRIEGTASAGKVRARAFWQAVGSTQFINAKWQNGDFRLAQWPYTVTASPLALGLRHLGSSYLCRRPPARALGHGLVGLAGARRSDAAAARQPCPRGATPRPATPRGGRTRRTPRGWSRGGPRARGRGSQPTGGSPRA